MVGGEKSAFAQERADKNRVALQIHDVNKFLAVKTKSEFWNVHDNGKPLFAVCVAKHLVIRVNIPREISASVIVI